MAYGTLATDTIQSSTAGTPPQFNDGNGTQVGTLCRAWVNYKGTSTQSVRASFNVSSVTYNSTGVYTVNFTNAMPDANYAVLGSASLADSSANNWNAGIAALARDGTPTTSSVKIAVSYNLLSGGMVDMPYMYAAIFR